MRNAYDTHALPAGGQLFLYAMRQLAAGDLVSPCARSTTRELFEMHAVPEGLPVLQGTMAAVAGAAIRRPVFNTVRGTAVLPDEQSFIDCLAAIQERPDDCACCHVKHLVDPTGLTVAMPFLIGTARLFARRQLRFAPAQDRRQASAELRAVH